MKKCISLFITVLAVLAAAAAVFIALDRFCKPLDEALLQEVGERFQRIVTIEDGARAGGIGSAVLEWMSDHHFTPAITRLGLPDHFVEHGSVPQLKALTGLDDDSIAKAIIGEDVTV